MKHFYFERSPEEVARRSLIVITSGITVFLLLGLYLLFGGFAPLTVLIGKLLLFAMLPASIAAIWHHKKLKAADFAWLISVSDERVLWSAPNNLGFFSEKSFDLHPQEIEGVLCRVLKDADSSDQFILILKNGEEILLNDQSGVDLFRFVSGLEKIGVDKEAVYEF